MTRIRTLLGLCEIDILSAALPCCPPIDPEILTGAAYNPGGLFAPDIWWGQLSAPVNDHAGIAHHTVVWRCAIPHATSDNAFKCADRARAKYRRIYADGAVVVRCRPTAAQLGRPPMAPQPVDGDERTVTSGIDGGIDGGIDQLTAPPATSARLAGSDHLGGVARLYE